MKHSLGPAQDLPESVVTLIEFCVRDLNPKRIILFGSRATGNHRETSDYDLLVEQREPDRDAWLKCLDQIEQQNVTLYPVDLVNYHTADRALREQALLRGKVLYDSDQIVD